MWGAGYLGCLAQQSSVSEGPLHSTAGASALALQLGVQASHFTSHVLCFHQAWRIQPLLQGWRGQQGTGMVVSRWQSQLLCGNRKVMVWLETNLPFPGQEARSLWFASKPEEEGGHDLLVLLSTGGGVN